MVVDRYSEGGVDKIFKILANNEPMEWKRVDLAKVIDKAYVKGYSEGEAAEREANKSRHHRITSTHGYRVKISRGKDFDRYVDLCRILNVRMDTDGIEMIVFDVKAFKQDGYQFENPHRS